MIVLGACAVLGYLKGELAAGEVRALHYHRRNCAVSLADCIAAQVAHDQHASLATSDPHLLDLCHAEGITVEVLTAGDGSRWTPT